jgi:hypothetical protein
MRFLVQSALMEIRFIIPNFTVKQLLDAIP